MAQDVALRVRPAIWGVPLVFTSNEISGIGTVVKSNALIDYTTTFTASEAAASTEKIEIAFGNGVTGEAAKETSRISLGSGTAVTGGGATNPHKIAVTLAMTEKEYLDNWHQFRDDPGLFVVPTSETTNGEEGFYYAFALITNDVPLSGKAETVVTIPLELTAKSYTVAAGGVTALTGATYGSVTTPGGGETITPEALTSTEVDILEAGGIAWIFA